MRRATAIRLVIHRARAGALDDDEKRNQRTRLLDFDPRHVDATPARRARQQQTVIDNVNVFDVPMDAVRHMTRHRAESDSLFWRTLASPPRAGAIAGEPGISDLRVGQAPRERCTGPVARRDATRVVAVTPTQAASEPLAPPR